MRHLWKKRLKQVFTGLAALGSLGLAAVVLALSSLLPPERGPETAVSGGSVQDRFARYMHQITGEALDGALDVKKTYWLRDSDLVAPKPDPEKYGTTQNPADLAAVLQNAEALLEGQKTLFQPDAEIRPGSEITYYLDETILCITWQHLEGGAVYTCSEVKIADPSQFRRFLSDGQFGSGKRSKATQMAADVHAVTASNGDYYGYRNYGNLVYNGKVMMAGNTYLDTCYIDKNGDLILIPFARMYQEKEIQDFVEEHEIRFSLAFGPILLEDGKIKTGISYPLGETEGPYSRAALCQLGPLHYMLVTLNRSGRDVVQFAKHLQKMGVPTAYALDGGQTSAIVTADKLMNPVDYGGERETSDIIYFATAVPDGG